MFQARLEKIHYIYRYMVTGYDLGVWDTSHLALNFLLSYCRYEKEKKTLPCPCKLVETIGKIHMSKIYDCTKKKENAPGSKNGGRVKN